MKAGKLCAVHPLRSGGLVALDVHGCLWIKYHHAWDWERLETPFEQAERLKPGHRKRSSVKGVSKP